MKLLPLILALALRLAAQDCEPTQPEQPQQAPPQQPADRPASGDRSLHPETDWTRPWMSDPDFAGHRTPTAADDEIDALLFLAHENEAPVQSEPGAWSTSGAWFQSGQPFNPTDLVNLVRDEARMDVDEYPTLRAFYEFLLRLLRKRMREEREKEKGEKDGDAPDGGGGDTEVDPLLLSYQMLLAVLGRDVGTDPPDGGGPDPRLDEYLDLARRIREWAGRVREYRDANVTDPDERKMYDGFIEDTKKAENVILAAAAQEFGEAAVKGPAGRRR